MTWEIVVGIITLLGSVIAIGKLVSSNTRALTKLEDSIARLDITLSKHDNKIDDLQSDIMEFDKRITVLENK